VVFVRLANGAGNARKQPGNALFSRLNQVADRLQERVRARLRALVDKHNVSHEILGKRLGLSRSYVSRMLNTDGGAILLEHIEGFCEFFQITPAELVAEAGSLIQPVTPIESALLTHFRQMTELERRSLLTILERPIYAAPDRKARMGRAMLTVKEQELVDLYARVKKDGVREGVLKTLRGAAEADERPAPRRMTE
jgi:transcriptional regulator with XRE-family HTH domain